MCFMPTHSGLPVRPQTPATDSEEVYLKLILVAEGLSAGVSDVLKTFDLTQTQYNALRILRGAGKDGATCTEIGERMVTKDSDITRLLDRLDARGLITRVRHEDDRRRIMVRITGTGLRLLNDLDAPVRTYHESRFCPLTQGQLRELFILLDTIDSRDNF
jgi:DNA-binding MarR family transcriptional regulator